MPDELALPDSVRTELDTLKAELERTRYTLRTMIQWTVQSANSPLSRREAERLLRLENGDDPMT